ncbi:MAG: Pvc16 family protein [Anaerolineae bacterium]
MINDLDESIRKLVLSKSGLTEASVTLSFDQPTGDWAAGLTRPTINLYLYDIRENLELRSQEWLTTKRADGKVEQKLAPRRYNLSYLITVWTQKQTEDEHAILWRVLAVLASCSTLPEEVLQGEMRNQAFPVLAQIAQPSIAIQNLPDLWSVMQNQLRPSINYVITLAMERQIAFTGPLVLTKQITFSRIPGGPIGEEIWQIAGIVHRKGAGPLAGVEVKLVEAGQMTTSDQFGRYSFTRIAPGTYHVQAQVGGKKAERSILVPPQDSDLTHYDLAL